MNTSHQAQLTPDDLLTLFLLEHQTYEDGLRSEIIEDGELPETLIDTQILKAFAAWGVKNQYFTQEGHAKLLAMVQHIQEEYRRSA